MDAAVPEILGWLGLLLGLTALVALLRSPRMLGRAGERRVAGLLRKALTGEPHRIFRDVTLPAQRGSSQIDVLAISTRGIFVVEVKNLRGKISGGAQRKRWWIQRGRRSFRMQNPVHQNHGHLKAVQETLEIPRNLLVPLVVFAGRVTFTKAVQALILRPEDLIGAVAARKPDRISEQSINHYAALISAARLPPGRATDRQHRRNVRRRLRARRGLLPCPRCGSGMEKRTARAQQEVPSFFWGCENFPRCRGTRDFEPRREPPGSELPAQTELGY